MSARQQRGKPMKTGFAALAAALALAGCGGSGIAVPPEVVGTWGNDCSKPWMTIGSNGVMHIVPTNADYPLKSATLSGTTYTQSYDDASGGGLTTETWELSGSTLREVKSVNEKGGEASFDGPGFTKCS